MTHILFVTPYYPPEKAAPAIRLSETAKGLVELGYEVTVLTTFPNYPTGIVPREYRGKFVQCEVLDGVYIVRVWSYITANKGFFRRILAQLSFGCLAPFLGWKAVGRPDIVIVECPPLFDAIAARLLSKGKRCPFIFLVSDIWPASAVQLGMLRNRLLIWLAERLEWSTYLRACSVWAVTEGIRDTLIRRGLAPERVFVLTNGVDTTRFRPRSQYEARVELGWDERFTVLYAGTHGLAQGLSTVLDAAEQLKEQCAIHFILVGDGATKAELVTQAREQGLGNITFADPVPHNQMPALLAAADVCLVPLRRVPLFEGALPSKMYEVMACERPVLLGVDGEARRLAEQEARAAIYVEPEIADVLASAILHLYEHPEVAQTLGRNGRAFVETRFDRKRLVERLDERIATLLGNNNSTGVINPVAVEVTAQRD
jgi:colanic acid biosynthesis glycosyl transferase WcaI